MLPALTLAVVVTFDVELIALTTLLDRLNPAAFRLPPVTLPVTLTLLPVITPPTTDAPVMVPVTLTVVPVCDVALTRAPPSTFPPLMLALVVMLAALTRALTTFELKLKPAAFKLPPVMLPVVENEVAINVPIIFPPEILPVVVILAAETRALTTLPLKLNPVAFKLPPVMLAVAEIKPGVVTLPPAILPVTLSADITLLLKLSPAASKLPPEILPVVVMFEVELIADNTFELKLNPAASKLPANTLPVALMLPEEVMPAAPTLLMAVMLVAAVKLELKFNALTTLLLKLNPAAFKLPPVTLPVTDTVVPVKLPKNVDTTLPANTLPVALMLPEEVMPAAPTLPVATTKPGVVMLPAAILLVTFKLPITFELKLNPAAFKLPAVTLPVIDTVVPV